MKWRVELTRPRTELAADGILAALTGTGDASDAMSALLGGQPVPGTDGSTTVQSPLAGLAAGMLQTQVTAFGETLKKSLREMRLTVSWQDGKVPRELTVSTFLVVLNPRAPGGARGDDPDVPPNLAAQVAATPPASTGAPVIPGVTGGLPGVTGGLPGSTFQPGTAPTGSRPSPFRRPRRNRSGGDEE
jgi:hypothetical protein